MSCVCVSLRSEFRVVMSKKTDVRVVFTSSCLYEGSCLIYVVCACLRIVVSNTYCVVLHFCFVCLCLVYPMLPVSLDSPFLIAPSEFSNVYVPQWFTILSYNIDFLANKICIYIYKIRDIHTKSIIYIHICTSTFFPHTFICFYRKVINNSVSIIYDWQELTKQRNKAKKK